MNRIIFLILLNVTFVNAEHYISKGKKVQLKPIIERSAQKNNEIIWFKTDNGSRIGVSDSLFVKFYENTSIEKYEKKYDLKLIKKIGKNLYLLKTQDPSMTLDIANSLSEEADVVFSHPNFSKNREHR